MANEILKQQEELGKQMDKSLINFKKSPKGRLNKHYVEVRLKLLDELWTQFTQNHLTLIKEEDIEEYDYYKKEYYSITEETYTSAKCEMLDTLERLTSTSTADPNQNIQKTSIQSEIKLPQINLPNFSGKYIDWTSFHDLFVSLIHQNPSLSKVQKLHYLKASLSGEAESLLKHISITESNYDDAWSTLNKRYNNKRFIVNSLLRKLLSLKAISTESSIAIRTLLDSTNECLNGLRNIGIMAYDWDPILVYITVVKLDSDSIRLWEQHVNSADNYADTLPTYKELCTFSESRLRTLEVMEASKPPTRSTAKQSSFYASFNETCKFCLGQHFIYNCKEFAQLTYSDRRSFIERNGLCYNCLVPHHIASNCRSKSSCRRCGKKHHSLIHPDNKSLDHSTEQDTEKLEHTTDTDLTQSCNIDTHFADKQYSNKVLLATALVQISSTNGTKYYFRALIDQGSQGSFITESAAQILGLKKQPINCTIKGLGNTQQGLTSNSMVTFEASSRFEDTFKVCVNAYVLKSLTRNLPSSEVYNQDWSHIHQLPLADPAYAKPGRVDLLLGADVYTEIILEGIRKGPCGSPIAQKTNLGWILSGQISENKLNYSITISMHIYPEDNELLQKFWEIESEPSSEKRMTEEEELCEQFFKKTYEREEDGRYVVSLPFKGTEPACLKGSSRVVAQGRLLQLERQLNKKPLLKRDYADVLKEYLVLGHMDEVTQEAELNTRSVYLPHHAVVRSDKATTKVRVVFDASCKYKNGVSLNDDLMVGPQLQQDLRHIIMRWRQHKICLVADIEKMYRQIKVKDPDYQRILWRSEINEEIRDFRINRVTFGTASAPYLATRVLKQLALDEEKSFPLAADIAYTDFYMDDLLTGCDSYEGALQIFHQMTQLLAAGQFQLQKWNSNNLQLLLHIHGREYQDPEREVSLDTTTKTLGIVWNNAKDQFQYLIQLSEANPVVTKRSIASDVSKLFDPMGWLAPTIVIGKVFLQRLWLSGVSWDQEVPLDICHDWVNYRAELPCLSEIHVCRWLQTTSNKTKMELFGFCDASTMAYAAVLYSRVHDEDGNIHVNLISAKTKVAPVKTISVPRLELCGAVLLTKLLMEGAKHLKVSKENIYAYTDSRVVLAWLQGHPSKWKTFIANRTSEIIGKLPCHHWNHVSSQDNPADMASRGVQPSKLRDQNLWWAGPSWLHNKIITHSLPIDLHNNVEALHEVRLTTFTHVEGKFTDIFNKYSSLEKLLRIIAICKRFKNIREHISIPKYITAEELKNALSICVNLCQNENFSCEIINLKQHKPPNKRSQLRSLYPFLDEKGILRVGGRLRHADIPEEAKHQIVLPNHNNLSRLIVSDAHRKTLHGGPNLMLNYIRQKYWILGVKGMIRQEINKCVICVRHRAQTRTQLMADLPAFRVTPARPFLNSGVDYAGPIDLRMSKGRGCKTYKGYICIFICMVTRAIHLEIVSGLDSASFIAAFKRFTARRGHCSNIWSDNGTNFIAGNKELKKMLRGLLNTIEAEIHDQLAKDATTWHNIPGSAPHFGGLWEAGVRSVKYHLRRILSNSTLTYEEMSTMIIQIESCLNSRPISPLSDNPDDLLPLTPGHFLIGEAPIVVPEKSYLDENISSLGRWQLVQRMTQHFWLRWSREYLSRLQQRPKWTKRNDNAIAAGRLVLVKDENLPPGKWSLARILDVHPGADGLIRVVTLKCRNATIVRPITKICLLPDDTMKV